MPTLIELILQSLEKVWLTLQHNWPFLVVSILISVLLKLYVKPEQATHFLTRYRRAGIFGATAVAVGTPFCSCGTTAVTLGMIASTIPWAPIIAFMVASPLTSPEELVYSAGLFGWPFAIAFFLSSILLGLLGGYVAEFFESQGWLANQARFHSTTPVTSTTKTGTAIPVTANEPCGCTPESQQNSGRYQMRDIRKNRPVLVMATNPATSACCGPTPAYAIASYNGSSMVLPDSPQPCSCGNDTPTQAMLDMNQAGVPEKEVQLEKFVANLKIWGQEFYRTGKQLIPMFLGFAFIGYLLNGLIPQEWVGAIFGKGNTYGIPIAATLGLPLYINTEGSLPLIRGLIDGGMSQGAALAFLITGAGTSIGAVMGALTIARWRVIGLVVATLWIGSVVLGYAYNALLALHLF